MSYVLTINQVQVEALPPRQQTIVRLLLRNRAMDNYPEVRKFVRIGDGREIDGSFDTATEPLADFHFDSQTTCDAFMRRIGELG